MNSIFFAKVIRDGRIEMDLADLMQDHALHKNPFTRYYPSLSITNLIILLILICWFCRFDKINLPIKKKSHPVNRAAL